MDKQKALALIQPHRKWLSKESDYAIARRVEHGYTHAATGMTIFGLYCVFYVGGMYFHLAGVAFFLFSCFCYWRSSQFMEIRQLFEDSWPQNFKDLDEKTDSKSAA